MMLATTKVEDFDRFLKIFSTKGAEKRKQHGSKGSTVFRDPNQEDRLWAIFDWDLDGWQNFASDPEVPAIMRSTKRASPRSPTRISSRGNGLPGSRRSELRKPPGRLARCGRRDWPRAPAAPVSRSGAAVAIVRSLG